MKRILITASVILFLISPAYAWQSKAVKKAKDYISAGMTDDAIYALETGIKEKPKDHEAHWMLGKMYLERGSYSSAETRFNSAILLKPQYKNELGTIYKGVGDKNLYKGKMKSALSFYDKAIRADSSLKSSISQIKAEYVNKLSSVAKNQLMRGHVKGAKQSHSQILALMPGERTALYQSIISAGNELDDISCFPVYQYASTIVTPCPKNDGVGKRLENIANKFEEKDLFDTSVRKYLELGKKYSGKVRDYLKTYELGDYPFELSKGETTHWIQTPRGIRTWIQFSHTPESKVKFIRSDGAVIHSWLDEEWPKGATDSTYKIKAIEKSFVVLEITRQ